MTARCMISGAMLLALAACGGGPPLPDASFLTAPATLTVAPRQTGYANPIRNYTARSVTDPSDWRESNRSQEGL